MRLATPGVGSGAVELNRRAAADVQRQGEGQVVQRAAPVQIQGADDEALTRQADIAAGDVQQGRVGAPSLGQADAAVGLARGQEGARPRREGQVGAGGDVVGQGDGAPGRDAPGVYVQVAEADAVAAQEEVPRRTRRAVVRAAGHGDAAVRSVRALAEAQDQVGVGQHQSAGGDGLEAGRQVDARLGQGAGQGPASVHVAADLDRTGREGAARVPVQGQPQAAIGLDQALRPGAAGGAGQLAAIDLDPTVVETAGQLQARGAAQQAVQFGHADREIAAPAVEVHDPRGAGAGGGGPNGTAEGALGVGQDARGVGQPRLAPEAQASQQVARTGPGHGQPLAPRVDPFQQDGAVLHPRGLQLDPGRRAQQAADDALGRAAVGAHVSVQVHAAVANLDVDGTRDAGGAVAGEGGVEQADLPLQRPVLRVALEEAVVGGGTGDL